MCRSVSERATRPPPTVSVSMGVCRCASALNPRSESDARMSLFCPSQMRPHERESERERERERERGRGSGRGSGSGRGRDRSGGSRSRGSRSSSSSSSSSNSSSKRISCPFWQRHGTGCPRSPVSNPALTAGCVCIGGALWCDLGCCSRTVVVFKLRRTSALVAAVVVSSSSTLPALGMRACRVHAPLVPAAGGRRISGSAN